MSDFLEIMVISALFTVAAVLLLALTYATYGTLLLVFVPGLIYWYLKGRHK